MPVAIVARWEAARRLYEGEPATAELVASACGWSLTRLRGRARAERWRARRGGRPSARLAPLIDRLTAQAAAIGAEGDAPLSPADLTAINAMLKTIQIIAEMTGGAEAAAEDRRLRASENDDRLAAILARIDDRIETLAKVHAREMLRQGWKGEGE